MGEVGLVVPDCAMQSKVYGVHVGLSSVVRAGAGYVMYYE
jgi:hypothetical protein